MARWPLSYMQKKWPNVMLDKYKYTYCIMYNSIQRLSTYTIESNVTFKEFILHLKELGGFKLTDPLTTELIWIPYHTILSIRETINAQTPNRS